MSRDIEFLPDDRNPYAPPSSKTRAVPGDREPGDFAMFLRWEKLRLAYNVVLGVVTILAMLTYHDRLKGSLLDQLIQLILPCLVANVCYCVGPVLEGYALLIGFRGKVVTAIIFGLGTSFVALLAWMVIVGSAFH